MSLTTEKWRAVAGEMHLPGEDAGPEVRVVLRNGHAFVGHVAGSPDVSTVLHLVAVEPNAITPSRPKVTRHRIDWDEIVAMSGTSCGWP